MGQIKLGIVPEGIAVNWRAYPEIQSFTRAQEYLSLLTSPEKASEIADRLQEKYEIKYVKSGDILRAAGLFAPSMPTVERQKVIRDINSKQFLNPVLLVKGTKGHTLHIADGYETVCALLYRDKGHEIPCHVTAWDSDE